MAAGKHVAKYGTIIPCGQHDAVTRIAAHGGSSAHATR